MTHIALPLAATALLLGACAAAPPAQLPGPTSDTTLVDATSGAAVRLDRLLSGFEGLGFSGAIIVEEGGRVVLRKGYGLADRAERLAYTPATVQDMGSVTKPITAAAILLLEQRGALSVHDPITRFFEDVPADKREITLHHLLTHTAGFPSASGRDADPITADSLLALMLATPLRFEPGAGWGYSNPGYSLLAMVIERVSGRGFEEFLRQEVLLPLGMRNTGYVQVDWPSDALAWGYVQGSVYGRLLHMGVLPDGPSWHLRGGGGLQTTVVDMHRWLTMLRGQGPLSASQVERWTTAYAEGGNGAYGYGVDVLEHPEMGRIIAHDGGNPAFSAIFIWFPDRDLYLYVHRNSSLMPVFPLGGVILQALVDADTPAPPAVQWDRGADPALAATRAGQYRAGEATLHALADDVRLIITPEGQEALDAFLNHSAEERRELQALSTRTATVLEAVLAGREDALVGLVAEGSDPEARARGLIAFLAGEQVQSATVLGSVRNVEGTQFAARGGSTTSVRTGRVGEGGAMPVLRIFWSDAGHYNGAATTPPQTRPSFVLVPRAGGGYTAVERTAPWRTQEVAVEGGCLVAGEMRACPDPSRER